MSHVSHHFLRLCWDWITWDRVGPLGGKHRAISWEVKECVVARWDLQGCSPHQCQLRTDGLPPSREQVLNVPIAYQRYEPDKPISWLSTEACLFPIASLTVMWEKLGTDPRTGQLACCELGREPFFSGAIDLFKSIDDYTKGLLFIDCMRYVWFGTIRRLRVGYMWCVGRVFPKGVHRFELLRFSDMSNRLFAAVSI
jgi:hypothetical protein